MLRSPTVPTESRLPLAARADAAEGSPASRRPGRRPRWPAPPTTAVVLIHVTGAVQAPGVYELPPGQRVADAIDAAGGALANADPNALNLAAPLADGDRIAVPTVGEASTPAPAHSHAGSPADAAVAAPVDVNTATTPSSRRCPGSARRRPRPSSSTASRTAVRHRSTTSTRCRASGRRSSTRSVTWSRCERSATAARGRARGSTRRGRRGRRSRRRSPASGRPARSRRTTPPGCACAIRAATTPDGQPQQPPRCRCRSGTSRCWRTARR